MDESTDVVFFQSVCSLNKQNKKTQKNCYIRANPNKNTENSEYETGMQEEEKCLHL